MDLFCSEGDACWTIDSFVTFYFIVCAFNVGCCVFLIIFFNVYMYTAANDNDDIMHKLQYGEETTHCFAYSTKI